MKPMASRARFQGGRRAANIAADTQRDESRYLEEIALGSRSWQLLSGTWRGEEEDHDGLSVQSELLVLNEDGTFMHTLAHRMVLANNQPAHLAGHTASGLDSECESSCSGRWKLFAVRHFGADLSAPEGDRELAFERGIASDPLLAEKLVVCGANPVLNGFHGHSCRIKHVSDACDDNVGHEHEVGARGRPEYELEVEDPEPSESDAKQLSEATGLSVDACFAALFQAAGNKEEAAVLLLTNSTEAVPHTDAALPPAVDVDASGSAEAVAEATGRTLAECEEALKLHKGVVDDAVVYLLSNAPSLRSSAAPGSSSAEASAASPLSAQSAPAEPPGQQQAVTAARLTEVTGQSYAECWSMLCQHNGNAEAAAAALLEPKEQSRADSRGVEDHQKISDTESEGPDLQNTTANESELLDPLDTAAEHELHDSASKAVADVHAQVNAEVEAVMGLASDETEVQGALSVAREVETAIGVASDDEFSQPSPKRPKIL